MSNENPTPAANPPEPTKEKQTKTPTSLLYVTCVLAALAFLNSVILVVILFFAVIKQTAPICDCYPYPYYPEPGYYDGYATPAPAEPTSSMLSTSPTTSTTDTP